MAHSRSLHGSAVLFGITWRFGSTVADQVDREDAPTAVGQGRATCSHHWIDAE
jgi:hypothetical protein